MKTSAKKENGISNDCYSAPDIVSIDVLAESMCTGSITATHDGFEDGDEVDW